jgi:nuclease S1
VSSKGLPLFLLFLATLTPARPALAWGKLGHRIVALVAETRLSPSCKAQVESILDGESLADASTWADEHKLAVRRSATWHYVNVPISASGYDASFCPHDDCVVARIGEFSRVLSDRSASADKRLLALRFVVHLVADVHQPVHVGDNGDRGGNDLQLRFYRRGTNLHKLWDRDLLEQFSSDEETWAKSVEAILRPDDVRAWSGGSPSDWANESLALAKQAYTGFTGESPMTSGTTIGTQYEAAALPLVRRRLAQAAVRLASMLDQALR